ncbi:MAG: hypothetical protein IKF01_01000 [Bacilli bacterium]|nr:hypothetical protein [Bacilli bacterium]
MRNTEKVNVLSKEDEISSLIYACIASADYVENKSNGFNNYNPINFIIDSLYDLKFEVFPHLNVVPDRGGARYIMNDVSSYRFSKGYKIRSLNTLKKLFEKYDCKSKEDIKKLLNEIYENRYDYSSYDDTITKALYAYKAYYMNNVVIEKWPNKLKLYRDFFVNMVKGENNSFVDYKINPQNRSIHSLNIDHIVYPEVKMLILTDGSGNSYEYTSSYKLNDYMNEWFNSVNPYDDNFKNQLEEVVKNIDLKFSKDEKTKTSASIVVIAGENTYVLSAGNTRVHFIKEGKVSSIDRKENFYDEAKEKNLIMPFSEEYAKSVAVGTIGFKKDRFDTYDSNAYVFPTSMIDGIFITTSDIHNYISDEELSAAILNNSSDEVLETLSEIYNLYQSPNGIMLWEKEKRENTKKRYR